MEKVGGVPFIVYEGGAVVLTYLGWRWWKSKHVAAVLPSSTVDPTTDPNSGLVDTSGQPAGTGPAVNNALPPASFSDDGLGSTSINPATGNPYAVDVAMPINPATGSPYQVDYTTGLAAQAALQQQIDDANAKLANQTPAPIPSPTIVTPVTPTPAAAPAPTRATPAKIPAGTVVWSGAGKPNEAEINAEILAKFGHPVSWHTRDNGAKAKPRYSVVTQ